MTQIPLSLLVVLSLLAPSRQEGPAAPAVPVAPAATAVAAINGFGIDLFKAVAKATPDGNLFLSPYSMSVALTIAAEGARGETESEMAAVLHFPEAGAPGTRAITAVHLAFAALSRQLQEAQGSSDPEAEKRMAELRARLDSTNDRTRELESKGDGWRAAQKSQQEAERIAAELNALIANIDRFDLRVANALWVERIYPLSPTYSAEVDRHYGSGAANALDIIGDPERARRRINRWVEDRTEQRIKDLIPSGALTALTRLVITNAIYFQGQWTVPFQEASTRPQDFTRGDGTLTSVRMMNDPWRSSGSYAAFTGAGEFFETPIQIPANEAQRPPTYPDDAGFQMLQLPYKGGDLAMVFLLPRSARGLSALEDLLTQANLSAWLARLEQRAVDTEIPRFKLEYQAEMSGTLRGLGMRRAFVSPENPGGAEFGGVTTSSDLLQQLFISAVLHKSWVEVSEKGTEAAAATAVMMAPAGAAMEPRVMVPFTPRFRADRPFLFLIRDTGSGAILFMGRMNDPA